MARKMEKKGDDNPGLTAVSGGDETETTELEDFQLVAEFLSGFEAERIFLRVHRIKEDGNQVLLARLPEGKYLPEDIVEVYGSGRYHLSYFARQFEKDGTLSTRVSPIKNGRFIIEVEAPPTWPGESAKKTDESKTDETYLPDVIRLQSKVFDHAFNSANRSNDTLITELNRQHEQQIQVLTQAFETIRGADRNSKSQWTEAITILGPVLGPGLLRLAKSLVEDKAEKPDEIKKEMFEVGKRLFFEKVVPYIEKNAPGALAGLLQNKGEIPDGVETGVRREKVEDD